MNRKTKIVGSTTGMLALAAFSGMIAGSTHKAAASTTNLRQSDARQTSIVSKAGTQARGYDDAAGKHDCKGMNSCNGQGGCNTGDQGCKGKNTCKGKGGCKTNTPTTAPGIL